MIPGDGDHIETGIEELWQHRIKSLDGRYLGIEITRVPCGIGVLVMDENELVVIFDGTAQCRQR